MAVKVLVSVLLLFVFVYVALGIRVLWVWLKDRRHPLYKMWAESPWERWQEWAADRYLDGDEDEPTFSQFIVSVPLLTPFFEGCDVLFDVMDKIDGMRRGGVLGAEEKASTVESAALIHDDDVR